MPRKKYTTLQIPQVEADRLKEIAEKLGVPRQSVIVWAIRAYCNSFVPDVVLGSTVEINQHADTELAAA